MSVQTFIRTLGGRLQMEMRIEIGHAVDAIERGLAALGELLQLLGRQIAVLGLDGSEVVENQRCPPKSCLDVITRLHYSRKNRIQHLVT